MSEHEATFEFIEDDGKVVSAHRHVNPDGSVGGWVAETAIIGEGVYIEPGASVEPGVVIEPGAYVYAKKPLFSDDVFGFESDQTK